jgi:hypothetical protein
LIHPANGAYGPDGARLRKTTGTGTTLYLDDDVELSGGVWTKYLTAEAKRIGFVTTWMHILDSRLRAGATTSPRCA